MTRPIVALLAGACVVITILIAVSHFRNNGGDDAAVRTRVAALAGQSIADHSGWSAKPGSPGAAMNSAGGGNANSAGAGVGNARIAGSHGSDVSGDAGGASRSASTLTVGERDTGGNIGFSGSHAVVSGDAGGPSRLSAPDAAVKFQGAGMQGPNGNSSGGQPILANASQARAAGDPNSATADSNEPVLSLPLDQTIQPEKGDAPVAAQGITFDGSGAKFAEDAQFVVPNAGGLTGQSGTISFNLQNDWTGNDGTDASLMKIEDPNQWQDRLEITKNTQYLRMSLWDDAGNESGVSIPITWQPGEQHQITGSWGDGTLTLYVDGRSVGQSTYPGQLVFNSGTPMYIGSDIPGGQGGARGTLSNVQVYSTKQ